MAPIMFMQASEGIDFADNQARGVVLVGIPFPNNVDTQVTMKKKFNETHQSSISKGRPQITTPREYIVEEKKGELRRRWSTPYHISIKLLHTMQLRTLAYPKPNIFSQ